tara:strand:- start:11 stop:1042 length:1032 start_codon:yes stop_codon:yes gene_type:complete
MDIELDNVMDYQKDKVKPSSYKLYKQSLKKLLEIQKTPHKSIGNNTLTDLDKNDYTINNIASLINNFSDLKDKLTKKVDKKAVYENNTIKNYLSALNFIKQSPVLEKLLKEDALALLYEFFGIIKDKIKKNTLSNEKSVKEEENWLSPEELDKIEKKLKKEYKQNKNKDTLQKLILVILYKGKIIRPLRNDYAGMYISMEDDTAGNYLYIDEEDHTKKYFVLNDYKTQRHYGKKKYTIPKRSVLNRLLTDLYQFRMEDGVAHFLENPGIKKELTSMSKNNLTKYLQNLFNSYLNKKVSSSMLRSIYISNLDFNKLSTGKLKKISNDMTHSFDTQQTDYKKLES